MSGILFCALTIEAFVNFCGQSKFLDWDKWDKTRPYPNFEKKINRLEVDISIFKEDLNQLFSMRHFMAHGRSETEFYDSWHLSPKESSFLEHYDIAFAKSVNLAKAEFYLDFVERFMVFVNEEANLFFSSHEMFRRLGQFSGKLGN